MTTERTTIKEGRFGSVSQPDLKKCRNKQLCLVIPGPIGNQVSDPELYASNHTHKLLGQHYLIHPINMSHAGYVNTKQCS